jgi:hypothetical protein
MWIRAGHLSTILLSTSLDNCALLLHPFGRFFGPGPIIGEEVYTQRSLQFLVPIHVQVDKVIVHTSTCDAENVS